MKRARLILALWACRLIPVWTVTLVLILAIRLPDRALADSFVWRSLFAATLCLYALLVYVLIPNLLANGERRSAGKLLRDFLLAGFTAGLYMIAAYWIKVDPSLREKLRSRA